MIAPINHSLITLSYEEYTTSQIQTHSDHCSDGGIHSFQGREQSDIEYLSEQVQVMQTLRVTTACEHSDHFTR